MPRFLICRFCPFIFFIWTCVIVILVFVIAKLKSINITLSLWIVFIKPFHMRLKFLLERMLLQFSFRQILSCLCTPPIESPHELKVEILLMTLPLTVFFKESWALGCYLAFWILLGFGRVKTAEWIIVGCRIGILENFIYEWYRLLSINVESIDCFKFFVVKFRCKIGILCRVIGLRTESQYRSWYELCLVLDSIEADLPPVETNLLLEHQTIQICVLQVSILLLCGC